MEGIYNSTIEKHMFTSFNLFDPLLNWKVGMLVIELNVAASGFSSTSIFAKVISGCIALILSKYGAVYATMTRSCLNVQIVRKIVTFTTLYAHYQSFYKEDTKLQWNKILSSREHRLAFGRRHSHRRQELLIPMSQKSETLSGWKGSSLSLL